VVGDIVEFRVVERRDQAPASLPNLMGGVRRAQFTPDAVVHPVTYGESAYRAPPADQRAPPAAQGPPNDQPLATTTATDAVAI